MNRTKFQIAPWQHFLLAAAIPMIFAAGKLNNDLWHDEAYTLFSFVARGPAYIVTDYHLPNNHVLYSLILYPFYLLGSAEAVWRLPSLLFTAGALVMLFRLARDRLDETAAVSATVLLGMSQAFQVHAMQIRGYGLSMFLMAWLMWLAASPSGSKRRSKSIAVVGFAFLYVMPSNLLFLAPLAVVSTLLHGRWPMSREAGARMAREACAWAGGGVLAALAYAPIADEVFAAVPPGPRSPTASLGAASRVVLAGTWDYWPIWPVLAVGLARLLWRLKSGGRSASRRSEATVAAIALGVLSGSIVFAAALRLSPFDRTFCPLLPAIALLAGWLMSAASEPVKQRLSTAAPLLAIAVTLAATLPSALLYPSRLERVRQRQFVQGAYYNYYAARYRPSRLVERLAERVQEDRSWLIVYAAADHMNLVYYLAREGLPLARAPEPAAESWRGRIWVIAPPQMEVDEIAETSGLSEAAIRRLPMVEDFGYYRLYRSAELIEVSPSLRYGE